VKRFHPTDLNELPNLCANARKGDGCFTDLRVGDCRLFEALDRAARLRTIARSAYASELKNLS
jgi:hypothetical protein